MTFEKFTVLLRVRYNECDAQKVVFNGHYGVYVDIVATELWRTLFGDYGEMLKQGIDTQVVKLVTEWKSPARFDEVLAISLETAHIGNTSFSFHLEFREFSENRLVATSDIVYVAVDPESLEKKAIPDDFRRKLELGAPGQLVNFSGIKTPQDR